MINTFNNTGTSLHYACRFNQEAAAILLLNAGAKYNIKDKYDKVPFDYISDPNMRMRLEVHILSSGLVTTITKPSSVFYRNEKKEVIELIKVNVELVVTVELVVAIDVTLEQTNLMTKQKLVQAWNSYDTCFGEQSDPVPVQLKGNKKVNFKRLEESDIFIFPRSENLLFQTQAEKRQSILEYIKEREEEKIKK